MITLCRYGDPVYKTAWLVQRGTVGQSVLRETTVRRAERAAGPAAAGLSDGRAGSCVVQRRRARPRGPRLHQRHQGGEGSGESHTFSQVSSLFYK